MKINYFQQPESLKIVISEQIEIESGLSLKEHLTKYLQKNIIDVLIAPANITIKINGVFDIVEIEAIIEIIKDHLEIYDNKYYDLEYDLDD